jgi:hypothetical protein
LQRDTGAALDPIADTTSAPFDRGGVREVTLQSVTEGKPLRCSTSSSFQLPDRVADSNHVQYNYKDFRNDDRPNSARPAFAFAGASAFFVIPPSQPGLAGTFNVVFVHSHWSLKFRTHFALLFGPAKIESAPDLDVTRGRRTAGRSPSLAAC